jgi:hypothetical protein
MSQPHESLDKLLDSLGFEQWKTVTVSIVLPIINVIGIVFCSLSVFIFFRRVFIDPIFVYYRLLCIVYVIHLLLNIPVCIIYSPRYLPKMNTHISTKYQIFHAVIVHFLQHFEGTLQMAILLTRMKLYSPFVEKHFSASPRLISIAFFNTCLLIDTPFISAFKANKFGTYFFMDHSNKKQHGTFYYLDSSDFSLTPFGRILLGFTSFFLNTFLTLFVGITLNILSVLKYKLYIKKKRKEIEQLEMSSANNKLVINRELEQFNLRQKNERTKKKNMLFMALTLSSISILSRIVHMITFVYFFIYNSFTEFITVGVVYLSINTFVPTVSILVFFLFNKMFRFELKKTIKCCSIGKENRETHIEARSTSS